MLLMLVMAKFATARARVIPSDDDRIHLIPRPLRPHLYSRLVWGEQGASNALAVAQQLGFDRAVLAEASDWARRMSVQGRESVDKRQNMQEEMMVRA